ncbi:hypothetical protein EZS27_032132 [termite gut metagenome]|uniref:Uncharacterized protein n=1 Tax=termite gut metagenome TaxID=433724 RepID=A0A5J4Q728_9ZZZZ
MENLNSSVCPVHTTKWKMGNGKRESYIKSGMILSYFRALPTYFLLLLSYFKVATGIFSVAIVIFQGCYRHTSV